MNIHTPDITAIPERDEAEAALDVLRRWAETASTTDIIELDPSVARLVPGRDGVDYPAFSRVYPETFVTDGAYKDTLPDLQNGPSSLIRGAKQQIQHVG
ncbi:MAG: GTP cyclohydrolase I FolE2, partial [Pseudomonadota bacterium]